MIIFFQKRSAITMNIAENIKTKRIAKSFIQLELANLVGVSQVAITQLKDL